MESQKGTSCNSPFSFHSTLDQENQESDTPQLQDNLKSQVYEASTNESISTKELKIADQEISKNLLRCTLRLSKKESPQNKFAI